MRRGIVHGFPSGFIKFLRTNKIYKMCNKRSFLFTDNLLQIIADTLPVASIFILFTVFYVFYIKSIRHHSLKTTKEQRLS